MITLTCWHRKEKFVAVFEKAIRRWDESTMRFIDPPIYGVALVDPVDVSQDPVWHIMESDRTSHGIKNPDGSYVLLDYGVRAVRHNSSLRNVDDGRPQPGDLQVVEVRDGEVVAVAQRGLTRGRGPGQEGYIWSWSRVSEGSDPESWVGSTGAPRRLTLDCLHCSQRLVVKASTLIGVLDAMESAQKDELTLDQLRAACRVVASGG